MLPWMFDVTGLSLADLELRRFELAHDIVQAATSRVGGERWTSAIPCPTGRARRGVRPRIGVGYFDGVVVDWGCNHCGACGVITGFEESPMDLARYAPRGEVVYWGVDDPERQLLWAATAATPALRAVIARADSDLGSVLRIPTKADELRVMYELVESLYGARRGRGHRELCDGLLAGLCACIDRL